MCQWTIKDIEKYLLLYDILLLNHLVVTLFTVSLSQFLIERHVVYLTHDDDDEQPPSAVDLNTHLDSTQQVGY